MKIFEVKFPKDTELVTLEELVEHLCSKLGLQPTVKRSLRTYPGSIHWHYKRGEEVGTLELTLLPTESRLRISIHDNRVGPWTEKTARLLKSLLHDSLFKVNPEKRKIRLVPRNMSDEEVT